MYREAKVPGGKSPGGKSPRVAIVPFLRGGKSSWRQKFQEAKVQEANVTGGKNTSGGKSSGGKSSQAFQNYVETHGKSSLEWFQSKAFEDEV